MLWPVSPARQRLNGGRLRTRRLLDEGLRAQVDAMTSPVTLCGSLSQLASPLGRSLHEAGYRALGLSFSYVPFEVTDLAGALSAMRVLGIRGFGISFPFKQDVIPLLDRLDPIAEQIGAVNTVVRESGKLVGFNTDWIGAVRALEEVQRLEGAHVLLLGAGGAARAIAFGLRDKGCTTTIATRDMAKAERLARESQARAAPWDEVQNAGRYDVVINATPVGQADREPASPVPQDALAEGQVVMDIVYKPIATRLLADAAARGCRGVHGGRMLLFQAGAQFEAYTGRKAPLEAMNQALRAALGEGPGR